MTGRYEPLNLSGINGTNEINESNENNELNDLNVCLSSIKYRCFNGINGNNDNDEPNDSSFCNLNIVIYLRFVFWSLEIVLSSHLPKFSTS